MNRRVVVGKSLCRRIRKDSILLNGNKLHLKMICLYLHPTKNCNKSLFLFISTWDNNDAHN